MKIYLVKEYFNEKKPINNEIYYKIR